MLVVSLRVLKVDFLFDEKVIDLIVVVEKDIYEGVVVKYVWLLFLDGLG